MKIQITEKLTEQPEHWDMNSFIQVKPLSAEETAGEQRRCPLAVWGSMWAHHKETASEGDMLDWELSLGLKVH